MILVAEHRDHELGLGPFLEPASVSRALAVPLERLAAVGVHLGPLRPATSPSGTPATLDRRLLAPGQPGPPRLDGRGVDDLAAHGEIAGGSQGRHRTRRTGARRRPPG
jgi:hypothetical protein